MNGTNAVILAGAAILGFWLVRKQSVSSDYVDPAYMYNNPANEELLYSSDDNGGVYRHEIRPPVAAYAGGMIEGGPGYSRNRREEVADKIKVDYPYYTGGTFLHPEFLPAVRTARIQGGRFIHPEFLPDTREYKLQRCYTSR